MQENLFDTPQWKQLIITYQLSSVQQNLLAHYLSLLHQANQQINLTAITNIPAMVLNHIFDSCAIAPYMLNPRAIADVGTGAGLPGIVIAILFPEIPIYLIEVIEKKIQFLHSIKNELSLANIQICALDWRTFIRTTSHSIDLFCARASLSLSELIRIFKPSSTYQHAQLVYWASSQWKMGRCEAPYFEKEYFYQVDKKQRRLIFFKKSI